MVYLIIFVLVVFAVLWGISIWLIKTDRLTGHDWAIKSLGLPRGSVRATLAFILLFLLVYSIITEITLPDLPDWLVGILGTIIGFYFGAAMTSGTQNTSETASGTKSTPRTSSKPGKPSAQK